MLSGLRQRLQHDLQDMEPSVISLLQSPLQNGAVDTGDLDIHLDSGDALNRTGDLEVHIAQEVFQTLNISQHGHIAAFRILDQAHSHTGNGSLDRNAGVHQAQGAAAHGSHGTGAVGGQDLAHQTQRVRELFLGRDHGQQSTLRQRTVTDLAAAGALHAARFAGGVGGHVVVVHIALAVLSAQTVQHLHVAHRAQRGHGQGLRFAAGENGAAVGTGQNADFAPDRTNVGQAASIGANALFEDFLAHDLLVEVIQRIGHLIQTAFELFGKMFGAVGLHLSLAILTFMAVIGLEHPAALVIGVLAHSGLHIVAGNDQRHFSLFLADLRLNAVDESNDLLDFVMSKEDGFQHQFFGNFIRARFHHQDGITSAADGQMQRALGALLLIGVDDQLAVHTAHDHGAGGAVPRNIADRQRRRGTDHRGHFRGNIFVNTQAGSHHLNVVAHSLGEQGPQGTVDQAAGQGRLFGGTTLALDEAAGNLAHGILLFFKVHSQREEIHAFPGLCAHGHVDHDDGIAVADESGTSRLLSILAEFDAERPTRQFCCEHSVIHSLSPLLPAPGLVAGRQPLFARSCVRRFGRMRSCKNSRVWRDCPAKHGCISEITFSDPAERSGNDSSRCRSS